LHLICPHPATLKTVQTAKNKYFATNYPGQVTQFLGQKAPKSAKSGQNLPESAKIRRLSDG
jgi:hypothetical protein